MENDIDQQEGSDREAHEKRCVIRELVEGDDFCSQKGQRE
jgi:hypothetical protein